VDSFGEHIGQNSDDEEFGQYDEKLEMDESALKDDSDASNNEHYM